MLGVAVVSAPCDIGPTRKGRNAADGCPAGKVCRGRFLVDSGDQVGEGDDAVDVVSGGLVEGSTA